MDDARYMARAIELARNGWYSTAPNPRVGCVLVGDDTIIGEGWHERAGQAHAEVRALADAAARSHDVHGATAYVTLEPCSHHGRTPPCADTLVAAGIGRAVIGAHDPNPKIDGRGIERLRDAGIEVSTGVEQAACAALNTGFNQRMVTGRPRICVKLAMTLDGRTAAANGESQWITGSEARDDVQHLRAAAGAVVIGSGTLLADDPALNVRLPGDWRQPMRVVLDSRLRTPANARMLGLPGETRIYTAVAAHTPQWQALVAAGAELQNVTADGDHLDLDRVLDDLGEQAINDVLVEAGPTLAGALAAQALVDEYIIYMAPQLLGDGGRGLLTLPGAQALGDRINLSIEDIQPVGDDWRICAQPVRT